MKVKETATVVSQREISGGIFDMILETPTIARSARPGQFVNVYLNDAARLLPRPISLCEICAERNLIRLVYRAGGDGTKEMSTWRTGQAVSLLGPLGNGFPLEEAAGKRVWLIGGGIGVPPLLETARVLEETAALRESQQEVIRAEQQASRNPETPVQTARTRVVSLMGYRSDCFLRDEFEQFGEVLVATEDGSAGVRGNVMDALAADGRLPEVIFACGPAPMLRAVQRFAAESHIPCWLSMEERMACGVGACLACVCRTKEVDAHAQVRNARVCADGPVFRAEEVVL